MSATPKQLLSRLDDLAVRYHYFSHPPVFTVEEARRHCSHIPGGHCKNLFLRSKKRHYWLLVLAADAWVDLNRLAKDVGAGRFGFASRERLDEVLGVMPGAVTPLALINDSEQRIRVVIDRRLLDYSVVNFHPLVNDATVSLAPQDLLRFIRACGREPLLVDFNLAAATG